MAASTVFVLVCVLTVASGQLGLPCMQKSKLQSAVLRCFSNFGTSDMINLDPTDKSGTLGQASKLVSENSCRRQSDVVDGLNCFYDFLGNCLNIRDVLPSRFNIDDAISYACKQVEGMQDPCLASLVKGMMSCYLEKVKDRQMAILLRKVKPGTVKDESCRYLKEEMTCLTKAPSSCSKPTKNVFSTFMGKLIPNTCRYPGLLETLKNNSNLRGLSLNRMDRGPR